MGSYRPQTRDETRRDESEIEKTRCRVVLLHHPTLLPRLPIVHRAWITMIGQPSSRVEQRDKKLSCSSRQYTEWGHKHKTPCITTVMHDKHHNTTSLPLLYFNVE